MSIDALSSPLAQSLVTQSSATTPVSAPVAPTPDSDGDADGSSPVRGHHHHGHGGGGMMGALRQTLEQLGVDPSSSATGAGSDSTQAGTSTGTGSDGSVSGSTQGGADVRDAMHAFLHDLMQAMRQQSGATTGTGTGSDGSSSTSVSGAGGRAAAYANAADRLQSVIDSLGASGNAVSGTSAGTTAEGTPAADGGSTTGSGSSANATLQSDFSRLMSALGSTSTSGASPSMNDFLKQFQQNLAARASEFTPTTGTLLSTQV